MPTIDPHVKKECVGSLLIPTSDIQELSQVKVQRRVTVGTLLIAPKDLCSDHHGETPVAVMQRRITKKLTGPAPPDSEAESWAD